MALVSRFKPRLACLQPAIGRSSIGAPSRPPESRGRSVRCLATATSAPASRPPNWVADLNARLGKCIMFGCSPTQVQRAAAVLREMASHWRAIIAGSESFITGRGRGLSGQEVAWGEMDSFQHVNNATYIRYAESARVNWIRHFASADPAHAAEWRSLMNPQGVGVIMKSITADYKFPVVYPDRVSVYHKLSSLPRVGDTAFELECIIMSHKHRRVAARTREQIVIYDYKAGQKTTIPSFVLQGFRGTWQLQTKLKTICRARIQVLTNAVEDLERETWNRDGAVEDSGSATKK